MGETALDQDTTEGKRGVWRHRKGVWVSPMGRGRGHCRRERGARGNGNTREGVGESAGRREEGVGKATR